LASLIQNSLLSVFIVLVTFMMSYEKQSKTIFA
jgi:hypothetical protein